MDGGSRTSKGRWVSRPITIALLCAIGVAVAALVLPWAGVIITPSVLRKATIAFLVVLEAAYVFVSASVIVGVGVSGALFWLARRRGLNWQAPARVLVLCVFSLIAVGTAELLVGLRRASVRRAALSVDAENDLPERFPERMPNSGITLAVLGGSSAFGMPFERWFSVGKIVAWQLERAIPEQKVQARDARQAGRHSQRAIPKTGGSRASTRMP